VTTTTRRCPRCKTIHPGPALAGAGVVLVCGSCNHRWSPDTGSDEYLPAEGGAVPPAPLTEKRTPPRPALPPDELPRESDQCKVQPQPPVSDPSFRPASGSQADDRTSCPVCGHSFTCLPGADEHRCPACSTSFQRSTGRPTPGDAPTGADPLIGRILRGCQIDRKLGEGGMGAVYHARQLSLDRSVAIKVLPPELARNSNFIQRFEREAKSLARINHANILQIYDFGDDPQLGIYFMVIEYVDGWDLGEVLRRQPTLSQIETLDIIRQALLGLEQANEKDVIHRDIKPDNLMIATSGLCKVSDFGLAKGSPSDSEVTSVGVRVGTPAFMSPEQCDGADVDSRSDVYNLGCTASLMLTGRLPYDGETPFSIMLKHKVDPVPSVRSHRADLDPRVDALIRRMMAKLPDDRCFEMRELIDEAEDLLITLTGTASILRKTNGPIRALVQAASGQASSGKRSALAAMPASAEGKAPPLATSRPSGRQRTVQPAPARPSSPPAIPDWLRPVETPATPPAPQPTSTSGSQPAMGGRGAPPRLPPAPPNDAQVEPPPTLATPFPGRVSPLPSERRSGPHASLPGAIDRARERGIKAEVASIAAGAERLAASGSWEAAAGEWKRAAQLARASGESRRLITLASEASLRARRRRRLRGLVIGALSAALLGLNLWIWPPVLHNLVAERERTRIETISDGGERCRRLRTFAAANQGGWGWYRVLFRRGYAVPAATAAALSAEHPSTPAPGPHGRVLQPSPAALDELVRLAADPAVPLARVVETARPLASDAQAATLLADAESRLAAAAQARKAVELARAQGRHGAALDLAARLASEQPRAGDLLADLPLPGRVRVTDADTGAPLTSLHVLVDGVQLVDADGRFCRSANADVQLDLGASCYASRRIVVPAAADPAERLVETALGPAPLWRQPAPASRPAWLHLHRAGTAVVALSPDGATAIDAVSGTARLLTQAGTRLTPWWGASDGGWAFVTTEGEQRLLLPSLDRAVTLRRLAGAPLALLEVELVYRAGGRMTAAVENASGGRMLIARDGTRELWRLAGVAGTAEPLLRRYDDKLILIDDLTVRVVEEDGGESARRPLKAVRTGPWAELPGGRLLVATTSGIELIVLGQGGATLVAHPWLGEAGPAVPAAAGNEVVLARSDRTIDAATWGSDAVTPHWHAQVPGRPLQAAIGDDLVAVADDSGLVTVIRLADGQTLRRIPHGIPAVTPPLLLPGLVVIADQTGALAGYRLPQ
jgi:serine/threonine protein kinase